MSSKPKYDVILDPSLDTCAAGDVTPEKLEAVLQDLASQSSVEHRDNLTTDAVLKQHNLDHCDGRYQWPDEFREDEEAQQLPIRIGDYRQITPIRRGGHAYLCLAFDEELGRDVALKIARTDKNGQKFSLESEIDALRQIKDERIVKLEGVVRYQDNLLPVIEWVDGWSLREILTRRVLTAAEAAAVTREIVRGLESLSASGWIHRDIKSSNVMLTTRGTVKIVDLGTAIRPGCQPDAIAANSAPCGTPGYMPPEQDGEAGIATAVSDLYSVGIMLCEFLSGQLPTLSEKQASDVEDGSWADEIRSHLPESTPDAITKLVVSLTKFNPQHRIADHAEVISILKPFADQVELRDVTDEFQGKQKRLSGNRKAHVSGKEPTDGVLAINRWCGIVFVMALLTLCGSFIAWNNELFESDSGQKAALDTSHIQKELEGIWPVEQATSGDQVVNGLLQVGFHDNRMFVLDRGRVVFIGTYKCLSDSDGAIEITVKYRGTDAETPQLAAKLRLRDRRMEIVASDRLPSKVTPDTAQLQVTTEPVIRWPFPADRLPELIAGPGQRSLDADQLLDDIRLLASDPQGSIRRRNHNLRAGFAPPPPFDAIKL